MTKFRKVKQIVKSKEILDLSKFLEHTIYAIFSREQQNFT